MHPVLVALDGPFARVLGGVHGGVGVAQQLVDGGGGPSLLATPIEAAIRSRDRRPGTAAQSLEQPVGDRLAFAIVVAAFDQDAELVAAEPRRGVAWRARTSAIRIATARSSSSPLEWPRLSLIVLKSSRSRNSTATGMAVPSRSGERVREPILEQGAVGKAGQRIVECLVAQLVLERLSLRDVAHAEQDSFDQRIIEAVLGNHLEVAPADSLVHGKRAVNDTVPDCRSQRRSGPPRSAHRLGCDELGQATAEDRIGVVAERPLDRGRLPPHREIGRQHGDHVAGVLDQRADPLLGPPIARVLLLDDQRAPAHPVKPPPEKHEQRHPGRERTDVCDIGPARRLIGDPRLSHIRRNRISVEPVELRRDEALCLLHAPTGVTDVAQIGKQGQSSTENPIRVFDERHRHRAAIGGLERVDGGAERTPEPQPAREIRIGVELVCPAPRRPERDALPCELPDLLARRPHVTDQHLDIHVMLLIGPGALRHDHHRHNPPTPARTIISWRHGTLRARRRKRTARHIPGMVGGGAGTGNVRRTGR